MSARQTKAEFFGGVPGFPISLAVRAGDYAYTATLGAHTFEAEKVTYDSEGRVSSDGSGRGDAGIEEQTRATIRNVEAALRGVGCTLEDVIDMTRLATRSARFHGVQSNLRRVLRFQQADPNRPASGVHVRLPDRDEGDRIQASGRRSHRLMANLRRDED